MTELAIADTSPLPPHVIRQLLEKLGVTYQARHDQPGIPAAQRVQTVLLEDAAVSYTHLTLPTTPYV